jgi:hypothetical protein
MYSSNSGGRGLTPCEPFRLFWRDTRVRPVSDYLESQAGGGGQGFFQNSQKYSGFWIGLQIVLLYFSPMEGRLETGWT